MVAFRLSHVVALSLSTIGLLVFLSFFTFEPTTTPRPDKVYIAEALLAPNNTRPEQNETTAKPNRTTTKPTIKPAPPGVEMTINVYVSGHVRPHTELCPDLGENLRLAIFVTSAPSHAQARAAVRLTWGHFAARSDVTLAFMLGSTDDRKLNESLDIEDEMYGDLIRGNSLDTYSNLTLKTISMLEWVDNYCPKVKWILKTDDDMFINVPRLLEFSQARSKDTRRIYGKVVRKSTPKRQIKSKYYVSPKQYPQKVYPDFATGPAYLLTNDTVKDLYRASFEEPYVRLEDVYVTGILARKLNITRINASEFSNRRLPAHPCNVQKAIAIHMVRYHEQFDMWKKLLDGKSNCGKPVKF